MMMNLFSIFDPSSSNFNLSWSAMLFPILFLFSIKYKSNTKWMILMKSINMIIVKEMKTLFSNKIYSGNLIFMKSLFLMIMISNLLALCPFIFTPTAHISISFTTALILWMNIMYFGWMNNTKFMMSHLLPTGTPMALMNFMVLIELTSNIIRPITLSVRLSANMVAGHLLMSLLSNFSIMSFTNLMSSSVFLLILSMLEIAVAFIQAYVFITLITLYHNEIFSYVK